MGTVLYSDLLCSDKIQLDGKCLVFLFAELRNFSRIRFPISPLQTCLVNSQLNPSKKIKVSLFDLLCMLLAYKNLSPVLLCMVVNLITGV